MNDMRATSLILVNEAASEVTKGLLSIRIIKAGLNLDGDMFYAPEALKMAAPLYQGVKMYIDHQSEKDRWDYPVGSLEDWAAVVESVNWNESEQALDGFARIIDPEFLAKVAMVSAAGALKHLGISHRALVRGRASQQPDAEAGAVNIVEEIVRVVSVDFVTEPGAGGVVIAAESRSNQAKESEMEIKPEEHNKVLKDLAEAQESIKTLSVANAALQEQLTGAQVAAKKAEVSAFSKVRVAESTMPQPAKDRVLHFCETAETKEQAAVIIETEEAYIASLGLPKAEQAQEGVKGFGQSKPGPEDEDGDDAEEVLETTMKAVYLRQGHSEDEAIKLAKQFVG